MSQWYYAEDKGKQMTQVVVRIPVGRAQQSEFGTLMLSMQKYPIVMETWCTTFFRLDNRPGPYLLIRADEFASDLKTSPLAVGLSFFKFDSGGLFVILVRVQNDGLMARLKTRIPNLELPAVEGMLGLDDADQVKRIQDAFQRDELHLVVASNEGGGMEGVDFSTGRSRRSSLPQAECDIKVEIPADIRQILQEQLRSLLSHHDSVPKYRRSWNAIQERYGNVMPLSMEPILPWEGGVSIES